MPRPDRQRRRSPDDLSAHRRQTDRWLVLGFFLILLGVGGPLIWINYQWGGLAGGLVSIVSCTLGLLVVGGLLWLLLTWAGRWAGGD